MSPLKRKLGRFTQFWCEAAIAVAICAILLVMVVAVMHLISDEPIRFRVRGEDGQVFVCTTNEAPYGATSCKIEQPQKAGK